MNTTVGQAEGQRRWLRHSLATIAYRAAKVLAKSTDDFSKVRACSSCRSAFEILSHINHLIAWALVTSGGKDSMPHSEAHTWESEKQLFFELLTRFDMHLSSTAPLNCDAEKLFQGPIADALTHVGQLATLRRLAGYPVRGEDYFSATIVVGTVGSEQAAAVEEFD